MLSIALTIRFIKHLCNKFLIKYDKRKVINNLNLILTPLTYITYRKTLEIAITSSVDNLSLKGVEINL